MSLPIIGITSDLENNGGYSKYPWYALRQNYCSSVTKSGGLPIIHVNEIHLVDQYSELLDGLIISGGDFDINPEYFGEKIRILLLVLLLHQKKVHVLILIKMVLQ